MTPQILALLLGILQGASPWTEGPPLPIPVANNAVAATVTARGPAVFSLLGLDSTKRWDGVLNRVFRWDLGDPAWREVRPVPGPGRLAATAQAWRGRIFLFGGYTVAANGAEQSLPNVDIYAPDRDAWSRGADMPVPVDDAVSGVWRDSLIFLISGWHDRDNVAAVQIYDPATDSWSRGTDIPGSPVFGHAGTIIGNTIVYVDGVRVNPKRPRFTIESASWRGNIDPADPRRITWSRLDQHPGPALYRAAAGAVGSWVLFAGGTGNPYNYSGVGYDGDPSEPRATVLGWNQATGGWAFFPPLPAGTMDHRGIVTIAGTAVVVGGMEAHQIVSRRTLVAPFETLRVTSP